jgi:hypothetical protein
MLQMAAVFAELERGMIRERVMAGLARVRAEGKKKLGRPRVGTKVENVIRERLSAGDGMLKVARALGVGVSTVSASEGRDAGSVGRVIVSGFLTAVMVPERQDLKTIAAIRGVGALADVHC